MASHSLGATTPSMAFSQTTFAPGISLIELSSTAVGTAPDSAVVPAPAAAPPLAADPAPAPVPTNQWTLETFKQPVPAEFELDLEARADEATQALEADPALAALRFRLVPGRVSEENFWRVFFYRQSLDAAATPAPVPTDVLAGTAPPPPSST